MELIWNCVDFWIGFGIELEYDLEVNLLLVVCTVISFVSMQATLQLFVACRTLSNEKLDWGSWEQRCGVVSSAHFVFINPMIPSGACCRRKTVMCSTSLSI